MKQAIAGVTPSGVQEITSMEVWPSIAKFALGRILGRLFGIQAGIYIFRVGNFLALAGIPVALGLYFFRLAPSFFGAPLHGGFYRLTNRRIVVLRNEIKFTGPSLLPSFVFGAEVKSVELDRFDSITIERLAGQDWFKAGDLVFHRDDVETFRLPAVSRPEAFRQTCLKAHMSFVGIKQALANEAVPA